MIPVRGRNNENADAAVTFRNVTAELGGVTVLDGISLAIPRSANTVIIGPNGAGKTTLLLALLGNISCSGTITFAGRGRPRTGYVPQRLAFDPGLPVTTLEFVCLALRRLPLWFGVGRRNRERALALLDLTGAGGLAKRRLGVLSGGELRRVLLASALVRRPELLILDEPTAGVDFRGEELFYDLLERLRGEMGFTQILVCHNLSLARRHGDKVVCLNRRIVAEGGAAAMLTPAVLARTFVGTDGAAPEEVFCA